MFPFLYYILVVSNLFKDRGLKFILPKRFYDSLLRSNFCFKTSVSLLYSFLSNNFYLLSVDTAYRSSARLARFF